MTTKRYVLVALSLAAICLATCFAILQTRGPKVAPVRPWEVDADPLGPRIAWPATDYAEVRGYIYNLNGDLAASLLVDGKLNKSVHNPEGEVLNESQVEQLLEAVARPYPDLGEFMCYEPRHGFVFYDATQKPVAFVEICFDCLGFQVSPDLPHRINLVRLKQLCQELNLPVFRDYKKYRDLMPQNSATLK